MATIYTDQHVTLKDLLAAAGRNQDATLLIPDLQRPYIWEPSRVIPLIDSLIRGWPFGTLLTWKVKQDDPVRALARPFWRVVDRTGESDGGDLISMKNPPASFQMVLDGQQRVQSLLLALGGDGWGFKLLDRKWHESLSDTKPRGPRGKPHWSLGCLCIDVPALSEAYAKAKRAAAINYIDVLRWIVADDANGRSSLSKPDTYKEPLETLSKSSGRFVRLARLWEAAPEQAGMDPYEAEELADSILIEHGVAEEYRDTQRRPMGALLIALKDVKQTRVTYLELAQYEEALGTRESYSDAVVNIFTRLNSAGRTLTREDITFAWLKVGWKTDCTENKSAKKCVEELTLEVGELQVPLSSEDVISAISFVWSVAFNSGKLLNNDDLLKGEAIRPMATDISENWEIVREAAIRICEKARARGLVFREHYQSVNALAYLWAWCFSALRWGHLKSLNELEKDGLDKSLSDTMDLLMDRWLICSQWANVWGSSSAQSVASFAAGLAGRLQALLSISNVYEAVSELRQQLEAELAQMEQQALNGLANLSADDRQQVRTYYTPLWLWNRLEASRWKSAQIVLEQKTQRKNRIEVDHIVAHNLWKTKLDSLIADQPPGADEIEKLDEIIPFANELGNCMLLKKNFNISKSNKPLKQFLDGVHEFTQGQSTLADWAEGLDLDMQQVDSGETAVTTLKDLFMLRTEKIRTDLSLFVKGTKLRVDV